MIYDISGEKSLQHNLNYPLFDDNNGSLEDIYIFILKISETKRLIANIS